MSRWHNDRCCINSIGALNHAVAQNFVVAESFDEFLGAGYHVGWFALEQIAYHATEAEVYFAVEFK